MMLRDQCGLPVRMPDGVRHRAVDEEAKEQHEDTVGQEGDTLREGPCTIQHT